MSSESGDPRRPDFRAASPTGSREVPVPDPTPNPSTWPKWAKVGINVALVAGWVVATVLALRGGTAPPAPPPLLERPAAADTAKPAAPHLDFIPAQGWVPDPDAVKTIILQQAIPQFKDTPAGKVVWGDEDVFLWRGVRKAAGLPDDRYPNINQRDVGCCVGCGWKHCVDVLLAMQFLGGAPQEWKPVAAEAIYALSRNEVGGGGLRGDGSVGAWAAKAVSRYGVVPMEPAGGEDFSVFDPQKARRLGATGLPDAVEAVARRYPVKGVALVRSFSELSRAIHQGYPVAVCSSQGFSMGRDADGFARPQGTWAHCMAFVAVRGGTRPGAFLLNSWGDQAHTGPRWPADAPSAGFWCDPATADRMLSVGDSFALSDAVGFPARKIDWFAARPLAEPAFAQAPLIVGAPHPVKE